MRNLCVIFFLVSSYTLLVNHTYGADSSLENMVKSAYLFKITQFIYWPESDVEKINSSKVDSADSDRHINLCIVGQNVFAAAQELENKIGFDVHNIKLVSMDVSSLDGSSCNILYIDASEFVMPVKNLLSHFDNNVITISDRNGFATRGGMIELNTNSGSIRMYINMKSIELSSISLSGKLLEVAELEW